MSKVKGPLFSIDASGSIGDAFFFSKWKRRKKVSKHFIPKNPQTAFQQLNRLLIAEGIFSWRNLSANQKQSYDELVKSKNLHMSGYNYYLSEYVTAQRSFLHEPIMSNLICWCKFDEDSGVIAYDTSGFGRNIQLSSNASFTPGLLNNCMQTAETDGFCYTSDIWNLGNYSEFTIMFWVYFFMEPDEFCKIFGYESDSIHLRRSTDGGCSFVTIKADHSSRWANFNDINRFEWRHLAVRYNGTRFQVYVDGVQAHDVSGAGGMWDGGDSWFFGQAEPPEVDTNLAKFDDFMVYDRYLSEDEIRHNINRKLFF